MLKEVLEILKSKNPKFSFNPDTELKLFLYQGKLYGKDPRLANNVVSLSDVKNRKILQKKD
jgi:hypothetical protein